MLRRNKTRMQWSMAGNERWWLEGWTQYGVRRRAIELVPQVIRQTNMPRPEEGEHETLTDLHERLKDLMKDTLHRIEDLLV